MVEKEGGEHNMIAMIQKNREENGGNSDDDDDDDNGDDDDDDGDDWINSQRTVTRNSV